MALKNRITKAAFDKLSDEVKEHYEADGDKHYKLEVDGLEDTGALTRARDREKERADELADEVKTLRKENKTLTEAAGEGGADVTRLSKSHERKITTINEEHATTLAGRDTFIKKLLINSEADKLANAISTVPSLMVGHIEKRMTVNFEGAEPKLVLLDKDGKPAPTLTVDGLKQELLTNAELKPILKGSQASGSSAQPNARQAGNSSAAPQGDGNKPVDVNALDGKGFFERVKTSREAAGQKEGGQSQAA